MEFKTTDSQIVKCWVFVEKYVELNIQVLKIRAISHDDQNFEASVKQSDNDGICTNDDVFSRIDEYPSDQNQRRGGIKTMFKDFGFNEKHL